ncbi:MAG: Sjogren's syndrome/scleroderma autoantigen 1 family protein [Nitrososphaerales archaeon]
MSREHISAAVELLRKGGTLVSESCDACGGVQVKVSGKTVCVNCGREVIVMETKKDEKVVTTEIVLDLRNVILMKISELLPVLGSENDLGKQEDIVKLIKDYVELLEKIPKEL